MSVGGSDQQSLEQRIALLEERLAQAQRLTALGELASTITHEFNNVLTTVINYAKMGIRHKDAETRDRAFEKILAAGNRAARITNSVLGMARSRSSSMELTDLTRLLDDTLLLLERELNKYRITVERRVQEVPQVRANSNQIQQVLLNLLINARQAMPQGGRLYILLSHDPATNSVDLTVRDTGCGMTPEVMQQIFEPFFSTKRGPDASGRGGTGLGLSTCRDIMEAHGGKIRVESSPGKGTAFTLKLPVVTTAAPTAGVVPAVTTTPLTSPSLASVPTSTL